MAIVAMKKMRLLALKRDRAKILSRLQKLHAVEIIKDDSEGLDAFMSKEGARAEELQKSITRLDWAISKLKPYDKNKQGMLSLKPVKTDDDQIQAVASEKDVMDVVKRLEEIERTLGDLRSREAKERAQITQLTQWENLDIPLEQISDTRFASVRLLTIPLKDIEAFRQSLLMFDTQPELTVLSQDRDTAYAVIITHVGDRDKLEEAVKANGCAYVSLGDAQGTPVLIIDQLKGRIERIGEVRTQLARETETLAGRINELKLLRDTCFIEFKQYEASEKFAETESAFLMTAWTCEGMEDKLNKAVSKVTDAFDMSFEDPTDDEMPPTYLRNNKIVRPFESIVNLYSTPSPRGFDPTFIMTPFYACFFGLMLSDAAYGIILGIVTAFIAYKLRAKGGIGAIAAVLCVGSIATIFWGGMLGGWFGIEDIKPWIGFTPMSEPLKMMVLCLALGGIQIVTGMLVSMYMSIKRKRPLDALFDQGFWLILFGGIALLFVNKNLGIGVMAAAALGIACTAGRAKKNIFGKITGGLGALYNITSYVSDILSYARLFGMGLATGVIAMVFNKVAMMMWGGVFGTAFAIVILVVGHVFNLLINTLGAYVHACRLQYIEFFGKFYEDGGVLFKPLDNTGRYMDFDQEDKAA